MSSGGDFAGMAPRAYDSVVMTYDGSNQLSTVTFKDEVGDTLVTLTLAYDGSGNLTSIVKS